MQCAVNSTSNKVGDNVNYTVLYNPLVQLYPNSIAQIQIQPWSFYNKSNFLNNNVNLICSGACTISTPPANGNNP
jgi:hypothetical protein